MNEQPTRSRYGGAGEDDGEPGAAPVTGKRKAGAFDIRVVIGGLIGFYGIVLITMGLVVDTAADRAKTGDVNANLWAGIGMVVVAAAFAVSVRLNPVIIEAPAEPAEKTDATGSA